MGKVLAPGVLYGLRAELPRGCPHGADDAAAGWDYGQEAASGSHP